MSISKNLVVLMHKKNPENHLKSGFQDFVVAAGGYDHKTMGEDMELVVKLHEDCVDNKIPYTIKYAIDAICWSQVPEKLSDLKKQRKRWHLKDIKRKSLIEEN